MTPPLWLIAGREFRAYVATASFWIALAIGPLLLGGATLLASARPEPTARTVSLSLMRLADGGVEARFSDGFPLSPSARNEVLRTIGAELHAPIRVADKVAAAAPDLRAGSRFALVMLLWMALVGSLGMLLQAVVRERANRALESLMAAATPVDIVLGKLVGVGGVSMLILGVWLGAVGLTAGLAAPSLVGTLIGPLGQPLALLHACGIYALAFAFYGLLTVALGALARDNADAQNMARPVFVVLLAVFFAALATAGGTLSLGWLVYLPPFAPFMLLLAPHDMMTEVIAITALLASTGLAARLAVSALKLNFSGAGIRGPGRAFAKPDLGSSPRPGRTSLRPG